jgi:hypothetical protein
MCHDTFVPVKDPMVINVTLDVIVKAYETQSTLGYAWLYVLLPLLISPGRGLHIIFGVTCRDGCYTYRNS